MKKLKVIMAVMSMVLAALMAFTACGRESGDDHV